MFSDLHESPDNTSLLGRFSEDVASKNISFFVVAGDLTEDATTSEYNQVKSQMQAVGIPYYATIGNHDLFQASNAGGWGGWKSTFGPGTYSVTIASVVRLIFIDSASGDIGDSQFGWLESPAFDEGALHLCFRSPLPDLRRDGPVDLSTGEL